METDFRYLDNIYGQFLRGENVEQVIRNAALEGYIFMPDGYYRAECEDFKVDHLLITGDSNSPSWFHYDQTEKRFIYREGDFITAFIKHYGVTRTTKGEYTMNGNVVTEDAIKAAILASLSIILKNPGGKVFSANSSFKVRMSQTDPQKVEDTRHYKNSVELFDDFMGKIQEETYKPLPTGMNSLDRLLGGGIQRQSLVILTAAPGTGKTTLAQQIFETMAMHGTDVIYLNLEMSREQLLARSLSRIIHENNGNVSASDILKGYEWKNMDARKNLILSAAEEYRAKIAPTMHYNPEECNTLLPVIIETLNKAAAVAKAAGKPAPVCVLDYLHLVTVDGRMDPQETVKQTVAALKQYAIDNNTFVFAISANNRMTNSAGRINLESGRDSSALEYTADILLSLNYRALHEKMEITYFSPEEGRKITETASANNPDHMEYLLKQSPREMLVQVLKNRMTEPGGKLYLNFYPQHSKFIPVDMNADRYIPHGKKSTPENDPDNPFL